MRKYILPTAAFFTILYLGITGCQAANGFTHGAGVAYSGQLSGIAEWLPCLAIFAFMFGFLPAYAHETLKEMKFKDQPQPEVVKIVEPVFVGQVFHMPGCNAKFTVKSLKQVSDIPVNNINYLENLVC